MSKKEEVLNSLSLWQSYQGKMLTTFIALCGFAVGAAGGVVGVAGGSIDDRSSANRH